MSATPRPWMFTPETDNWCAGIRTIIDVQSGNLREKIDAARAAGGGK